ncbi:condensation domain-containing protein [Gordonia sp. NPDC003376]
MRLIDDDDWTPEPGTILEWSPSAATLAAAAAAPAHPVGPSFLQRDHISAVLVQRADGRIHRGYTCSTVHVDESLDTDRMTVAITEFLGAHEGMRSSFRMGDDGQPIRFVVDTGDVSLVVTPSEDTDPLAHIDRRLPTEAVFDAFPGCAFGAVSRPGSFDLYFGIDHAYGDGASQVLGLVEILARYRGDTSSPLVTTHGSHIDHTTAEYARAAQVTPDSESVTQWRHVLTGSGGRIPVFPLPLGLENDEPQPVWFAEAELADAAGTDRLVALAKQHGTGLTGVLHTALAIAGRLLDDREWYATATVLSSRSGEHMASQGWYVNFAPLGFPVPSTDFVEVLEQAGPAVEAMKRASADPVHAALGILLVQGVIDPSVVVSPQMVNLLDFRWFPTAPNTRDLVVFTGEGRTRNASMWAWRTADGLRIGTQYPGNPVAQESVTRFFATVRDIIAAAVTLESEVA